MQTHLKAGSTLSTDNRSVPGAKEKHGIWKSSLAGHIDVWRPDPVPRVCWSYSYTCLPLGGPEFFPLCSWSPCRDSVIIRASGGQNSTCPNAQNLWLSHCPVIMSYGMVGFIRRFSRWTLSNLMGPLKSREFSLMAEKEEIWRRIRTQCALGGNRVFEKECGWNSRSWDGSGNWGPLSSIYPPPKESGFCHTYVHLEEDPTPPEENVACPTCGPPKSHMVPDFCPTDLCRDTRMAL